MEIPSHAYTTICQKLIGCSALTQSRIPQADWLMLENIKKATLNTNMPYSKQQMICVAYEQTCQNRFSKDFLSIVIIHGIAQLIL